MQESAEQIGTACVFCNGQFTCPERVKEFASRCDLLLAADGGSNHLARLNLKPHVIIGDMDSIASDPWAEDREILRVPYSTDKDKSDTELAVEYVFQQGCQQITLIAATGGRLDHTLGNIALIAQYPGRVAIQDGNCTLVAVDRLQKCVLHGPVGTRVSLIPYGLGSTCVRTTGLKYSLYDEILTWATQGLSNEIIDAQANVFVSEGIVLVCTNSNEVWPLQ